MEERLNAAFNVCLSALETGASVEQCLQLFPDLESDLRPLLTTAQAAQNLGREDTIPRPAQNRSRAQMLTQAGKLRQSRRRSWFGWGGMQRLALSALALIFVFAISFSGLAGASAKALPGDTLYPVKLAAENVRLQLAPNVESRHALEAETQHRRADEVHQLINLNRVERVSFDGRLDAITAEGWVVEGILVVPAPDVQRIGNIQLGDIIEVEGYSQPTGWIMAEELHLRYFELAGEIDQLDPHTWQVAGVQLKTIPGTQYSPSLRSGDQALALVHSGDDGHLYAYAITPLPEDIVAGLEFDPFPIEFEGKIESISSQSLIVNGKTVILTAATNLEGDLTVGSKVYIEAQVNLDSSLTALNIREADRSLEVESHDMDESADDGDDDIEDDSSSEPGDDEAEDPSDDNDEMDDDSPGDDDEADDGDDPSDSEDDEVEDDSPDSEDPEDEADDPSGSDDGEEDPDSPDDEDPVSSEDDESDGSDDSEDPSDSDGGSDDEADDASDESSESEDDGSGS